MSLVDSGALAGALLRSEAVRRLLRDLKEIQEEPIPTISAVPSENDVFNWHCNLRPLDGIYKGVVFHLELNFPHNYPHSPPSVLLSEVIPHPNVFSRTFFCLNILRPLENAAYSGWSTAYTAQAVLLQIHSFLFGTTMEQDGGYKRAQITDSQLVEAAKKAIRAFRCQKCGHRNEKNFPPLPHYDFSSNPVVKRGVTVVSKPSIHSSSKSSKPVYSYDAEFPALPGMKIVPATPAVISAVTPKEPIKPKEEVQGPICSLPEEMLMEIFSRTSFKDLLSLMKVSKGFAAVISNCALLQRRELICYHSKVSWQHRVLGFGVSTEKLSEHNTAIRCSLDLLSANAFYDEKLRTGIWKESFHHFLPIVINPNHGQRAERLMMAALSEIASRLPRPNWVFRITGATVSSAERNEAAVILAVLPKLMNQMIVNILMDNSSDSNQRTSEPNKLHIESSVSDKALLGYCTFHHMLLYLMQSRAHVRELVNRHIRNFIEKPSYRNKDNVPDLGEFLVLLSLSGRAWSDVAILVLKETILRNVRWVLRANSHLKRLPAIGDSQGADFNRLADFYKSSKTSYRLLMFQVYFMVELGSPEGKTQQEILERYNLSYGLPQERLKTSLAKTARAILKVDKWTSFFTRILVDCPSPAFMTNMLVEAQRTASVTEGYSDELDARKRNGQQQGFSRYQGFKKTQRQ